MEQTVIFIFGAINYMAIEILWRGHTHWSMGISGGLCALLIYICCREFPDSFLLTKCLAGAIIITAVELITGIIVNLMLKWNIWDYSEKSFNFMGQICPLYFFLWFLLCIPVVKLFEYLQTKVL